MRTRSVGLGIWPLACITVYGSVLVSCGDLRSEGVPVIEGPSSTTLVMGDSLTLTIATSAGKDAVSWFSSAPRVAVVRDGKIAARRPGTTWITVFANGARSNRIKLTVLPRPEGYSSDEIDYFIELAFESEYGLGGGVLRRWRSDTGLRVRLMGNVTATDQIVIESVRTEIERLTPLRIQLVEDSAMVEMHFVRQIRFREILPDAPPGNAGLVWVWWDPDDYLCRSVVLIATDVTDRQRSHLIREELTQALGLLEDSNMYPESVFYQDGSSQADEYSSLDRAAIELLYRDELRVGMTIAEAASVARLLTRFDRAGPVVQER